MKKFIFILLLSLFSCNKEIETPDAVKILGIWDATGKDAGFMINFISPDSVAYCDDTLQTVGSYCLCGSQRTERLLNFIYPVPEECNKIATFTIEALNDTLLMLKRNHYRTTFKKFIRY